MNANTQKWAAYLPGVLTSVRIRAATPESLYRSKAEGSKNEGNVNEPLRTELFCRVTPERQKGRGISPDPSIVKGITGDTVRQRLCLRGKQKLSGAQLRKRIWMSETKKLSTRNPTAR